VITQFNGAPVVDANGLTFQVTAVAPDTKVNLEVLRDGKTEKLAATTAQRPGHNGNISEVASTDDEGVLNGVAVEDLTPDARREMHLPSRLKGAVVSEVAPDSASARAGVSAGDVILEINRQRVNSAEDAINFSAKAENKKTLLKLWSHGATIFVVVDETDSAKGDS
jgi:serine protease Do